jgi:ribokinase
MPGIALIPVDCTGRHHIYAIPGANEQFSTDDLESGLLAGSSNLFETLVANHGILLTTLEAPLPVVRHLLALGKQHYLPVILDPGGFQARQSYEDILGPDIFLLKPNEAELEHLTGLEVKDISSAMRAARLLREKGIPNVLVTLGANGALLVTERQEIHIRIPLFAQNNGGTQDETGCGDQATAALCAALLAGEDLLEAAQAAVVAGTLQFYRKGIVPLTQEELSIKLSEVQDQNKAGS